MSASPDFWKWAALILAALLLAGIGFGAGVGFGGIVGFRLGEQLGGAGCAGTRYAPWPVTPPEQTEPGDPRAWLGVAYQMVEVGAQVAVVMPGSPAERAGLREGDLVTHIDDVRLTLDLALDAALSNYAPGERVTFTVQRDGTEPFTVEIELEAWPEN